MQTPNFLSVAQGAVLDPSAFRGWPAAHSGNTGGASDPSVALAHAAGIHLPEVVIYEHIDFGGVEARTNLAWHFVGGWWNDKISSIVVVSGTWRFYEHWHFEGRYWDLGPGYYRWVEDAGIPNDIISSFQPIAL